jgi:hypothetical protein
VRCPQPACSRPRCHPTAALPMLPVAPATAPPHVFPPRHRQRHKSVQPLSCTPSTRELRHRIAMLAAGGARPRMRAELLYQSREIGARKVCTARVVRDGTQIDRRGDGRALCTVRPAPNPKQDAAQWRSTNGASCAMRSGTRPRVAMQGAARLVASATAQRCWDGWALWQVCEGSSHARVLWAALHREAGPSCKTHTYMYVAEIGLTGMAACSRPCERRYPNLYASHTASFSAGSAVQCSAVQCSAAQRCAGSAVQRSAAQCRHSANSAAPTVGDRGLSSASLLSVVPQRSPCARWLATVSYGGYRQVGTTVYSQGEQCAAVTAGAHRAHCIGERKKGPQGGTGRGGASPDR